MSRRIVRGAVASAGALGLALTALPAHAAEVTSGHYDVLDVDVTSSAVTLDVRSTTDDDVDASTLEFVVPRSSTTSVPSSAPCIGPAGSTMYVAPAVQRTGVPWLGWDTADVASGTTGVRLVDWSGPTGSRVAVWTSSLGGASVKLSTSSSLGCARTDWLGGLAARSHSHPVWGFSKVGTYRLTFVATTPDGRQSNPSTVTVVVR